MDVALVDFKQLVPKLNSDEPLTAAEIDICNRIVFDNGSEDTPHGDVLLVLGNPKCLEDRIVRAVELMKQSNFRYIVLSGGVKMPDSELTEAEGMYQYCIDAGIPANQIVLENRSTTTRENFEFSAPLIAQLGLDRPRIVVVSSATHIRRSFMNFQHYKDLFPAGCTFGAAQSIHPSCHPDTWHLDSNARKIVSTEMWIIREYIVKDGDASFEI